MNDLCFGVLLIDRRLLINEEMQRTIAANHDKLLKLLKGGVAMQCDVDALAAELATARQQHSDMEAQRTTFLKVLSLFIGQDVSAIVTPRPEKQNNNGVRPELRMFDSQLSLTYAKEDALKASLIPQVGLFAQGYYGYPGMDMFHDMMHRNPTLNGIIGVRASWNISAFYTNKNDRAKLSLERQTIENDREVFLFNQRLQRETEDESIVHYQKLMEEDDEICRLRRSVRQAAEAKLESGTIDASTLISEIARETQAGINRSLHEVEMMQHQYKRQIIIGK
ncbi:MAG: TolC family protein [Prevotella sp.]|nr:TolC family protein [Prevotella sp.]